MSERAADTRDEYGALFDIYWPIGVAVFLIVVVAVVVVVFRYRSDSDEFPDAGPTVGERKNMPLEGGYALLLAAVVGLLLYFTFDTMADLESGDEQQTASAETGGGQGAEAAVDVTATRWSWRFEYEDGPTVQGEDKRPPTLVVPSETPIRFRLTSRDVVHSFWIPHVRFKRDAFPGRTTSFVLRFAEADEGFHREWGECAEFCGLLHADMSFHVEVVPRPEFDRWLAETGTDA